MESQYMKLAKAFKALSDPKRVKIVDMLSCGEMCGCVLLKCFEITQPTLERGRDCDQPAGGEKDLLFTGPESPGENEQTGA